MLLSNRIQKGIYQRGLMLEQEKEPALSRTIKVMDTAIQTFEARQQPKNPEEATADEIITCARLASIVDETDGVMLADKLQSVRNSKAALWIDAIDDEPYVSSQLGPMLQLPKECAEGFHLASRVINATKGGALVYRHIDMELSMPKYIEDVPVYPIGGKYPAEKRISEMFDMDSDGNGFIIIGACALIHLYRAVYKGQIQSTAFVTVAGNCIGYPRNIEAPIGTSGVDIIKMCGLLENPTRIVLGGPITGTVLQSKAESIKLSVLTRAILAIRDEKKDYWYTCINCGKCCDACPEGLNPKEIIKAIKLGNTINIQDLGIWECSHCMCCSYICPARLSIAGEIVIYQKNHSKEGQRR